MTSAWNIQKYVITLSFERFFCCCSFLLLSAFRRNEYTWYASVVIILWDGLYALHLLAFTHCVVSSYLVSRFVHDTNDIEKKWWFITSQTTLEKTVSSVVASPLSQTIQGEASCCVLRIFRPPVKRHMVASGQQPVRNRGLPTTTWMSFEWIPQPESSLDMTTAVYNSWTTASDCEPEPPR